MRNYSTVSPQFWIGRTGKEIRKAGPETTIVAMYLLTSPHANMLGLYYLPLMYIAHETGLGLEGASKGLAGCIKAGFCDYEEASEMVWVYEMARHQVGESLKDNDLRSKGVQNDYDSLPENRFLSGFYDKYGAPFNMKRGRGLEAPKKPHQSQEQDHGSEQEQNSLPPLPAAQKGDGTTPPAAEKSSAKGNKTFRVWYEQIRQAGEKPIPEGDPIFAYAEDAKLPEDYLRLAWVEFRDRYTHEEKRYKDWRMTFRKSVRENWFRLWQCREGEGYSLTSKGQQAMQAFKARHGGEQ